ncbi:MAG: hypothetical protein WCG28_04770 [bacterium]
MDILAHTLWTTAVARKGNIEGEKKDKKFKVNLFWTAFMGIFPDFFAFTLPFVFSFYKVISGQQQFGSFNTRHQVADGFNLSHTLYQYSHSLILWLLVFLIFWLIFRRPVWELLGWALHILIDIPSHSVLFFPTPFLFPISTYVFPYGVAWSNMYFMIINYTALALLWGGFLFKKYKNKKLF